MRRCPAARPPQPVARRPPRCLALPRRSPARDSAPRCVPSSSAATAASAACASAPAASSPISSPWRTPSDMSETALAALARRPCAVTATRASKSRSRRAISAAGRAWMPCGSGTRSRKPTVVASGAVVARLAPSIARSSISSSPCATERPSSLRTISKRSPFVTSTGVTRLGARRATTSRSNLISGAPASTRVPASTCASKPSPLSATVSMPTCIRSSAPMSVRRVTACPVGATEISSPAQGACRMPEVGSMARPSPSIRCANTASGTSSSGIAHPESGDMSARGVIRVLTRGARSNRSPTSGRCRAR